MLLDRLIYYGQSIIQMDPIQQIIMDGLAERGYVPDFFKDGKPAFYNPRNGNLHTVIYFHGGCYYAVIDSVLWVSGTLKGIIDHVESQQVMQNIELIKGVHDG